MSNYSYHYPDVSHPQNTQRSYDVDHGHGRRHGEVVASQNTSVPMARPPVRLPLPVDPHLHSALPNTPISVQNTNLAFGNGLLRHAGSPPTDTTDRFRNGVDTWNPQRIMGPVPPASHTPNKRQRVHGPDPTLSKFPSRSNPDYETAYGNEQSPPNSMYSGYLPTRSVTNGGLVSEPEQMSNRSVAAESIPEMSNVNSSLSSHTNQLYHNQLPEGHGQSADSSSRFPCSHETCNFVAKCQSDLKKHKARHERPNICHIRNCPRRGNGFSTINDLERHRKCVHGIEPSHGLSKTYKCFAPNCSRTEKRWPRLDNFKQHLKRIHGSDHTPEQLNAFVKLAEVWYDDQKKENSNMDFPSQVDHSKQQSSSYGDHSGIRHVQIQQNDGQVSIHHGRASSVSFAEGSITSSQMDCHSRTMPGASKQDHHVPPRDIEEPVRDSAELSSIRNGAVSSAGKDKSIPGEPERTFARDFRPSHSDAPRLLPECDPARLTSFMTAAASLGEAEMKFLNSATDFRQFEAELAQMAANVNNGSGSSSFPSSNIRIGLERMNEIRKLSQQITKAGFGPVVPPSGEGTQGALKCVYPNCGKAFDTMCQLTKHVNRHYRLWACTFRKCNGKRFGSKNDWIRHEEIQHPIKESWICDVPDEKNRPCHVHFWDLRQLEKHARNDHCKSETDIRDMRQTCRLGKLAYGSYWCGFCRKRLTSDHIQENPPQKIQRMRVNHIELEHFKKGQKMSDWVHVEDAAALRDPSLAGKRHEDYTSSEESHSSGLSGDTLVQCSSIVNGRCGGITPLVDPRNLAAVVLHHREDACLFICCVCQDGPNLYINNKACPNCQHRFCGNCRLELDSPNRH